MFAYRLRYLRREDSLSWSCTNWNEWQRLTPSSISLKIIALRSPPSAFSLSRSATAPSRKEPDLDFAFCIVRDVENAVPLQTIPHRCRGAPFTQGSLILHSALRSPPSAFSLSRFATAPSRQEPDFDFAFCIVRDVEDAVPLQTIPQSLCDSSLYTREPNFAFCITKSAVAWCFLIKRKAGTIPAILYSYLRIVSAF